VSYVSEVLADSPSGYWRLGETSGTAFNDESPNNNDGTSVNSPTLNQAGAISDGNPAVRFVTASLTSITVPDHLTLDLGDVFSLEAWVKMTATSSGTNRGVVSKGNNAYYMRIESDDRLRLTRGQVLDMCKSTVAITDTNYHHCVATKNGAAIKLYIDAVDVTGAISNSTCVDNATALAIGSERVGAGNGQYSNDTIDEVAVYPTVLSQARVTAHFQAASGVAIFYVTA
jgi:hypothetical protein